MAGQWKPYRVPALDGGLNLSRNPTLLSDAEAADLLNIELDKNSLKAARGAVKFNNQNAPKPGLLTKVDPALSPLSIEAGRSVPLRGYGYLPYNADLDIGGDFVSTGSIGSETFHTRRGKSFSFEVSFKIPSEEKIYGWETRGTNAPTSGDLYFERNYGFDEATDECFCILQKGGDRLAPMSWFLGVANVGATASSGTQTGFQRTTGKVPGARPSNYALVFGWYDVAGWAEGSNSDMRYSLSDPSASSAGAYSTSSVRALVTKHFVEPGKAYHVGVQVSLDTAAMTDSSWNDDGYIQIAMSEEASNSCQVFGYSASNLLVSTHDLVDGVASGDWTVNAAFANTTREFSLGHFGSDHVSRLGSDSTATSGVWIAQTSATAMASGTQYTLTVRVREKDATWLRLNIRNNSDGQSHIADYQFVAGVLTWDSDTGDLDVAVVIDNNDGTYDARISYTGVAGDAGDDLQALVYTSYLTTGGNPDITVPDANTGTYILSINLETGAGSTYEPNEGLYYWKGPTDSAEYLAKFGIRYSARDAVFLGLGYRMGPWKDLGFIPFGADSSPLEHGGFCMVDRTAVSTTDLYGGGAHTLTIAHTSGLSYIVVNHQGLTSGNTNGAQSPVGPDGAIWSGYGGTTGNFNAQALRGYRMVSTSGGDHAGGLITLDSYSEPSDFRISLLGTGDPATFSAQSALVQCFRWTQRPLVLSEIRFYSTRRDYADPRTRFSLRSEALLDDATDPNIAGLKARWPLDDGEGGVLREVVGGRDGYVAPFGLGVSTNGSRGENQLFLSGEGEALVLDLEDHPVFKREFSNLLKKGSGGFAVEVSCILPEAFYAIDDNYTGSNYRGKFAPHILTWEIKDPENDGLSTSPQPLLVFTHRGEWTSFTTPVRRPMGFSVLVGDGSDQEDEGLQTVVPVWTSADGFFWEEKAGWVGKRVTFQIGIQSTGTDDTYNVYVAALPKSDLFPDASDDPGTNLEFAWFGNVKGSAVGSTTFTIKKKDLVRSVITIGGCWDAKTLANGYSEANCRMIVDEVRVYGCVAPGSLPSTNGTAVTTRDGKLQGARSLPARQLSDTELLHFLGEGTATANLTEGSTTVSSPGATTFFDAEPEDTIKAVKETYLVTFGDSYEILEEETIGREVTEFYFVSDIASNGDSLTLETPYGDATRKNASAFSFRLVGYCTFEGQFLDRNFILQDIRDKPLTLGQGETYVPGTTTVDDATLTSEYFRNPTPLGTNWRLRVFSPLGSSSGSVVVPAWTRGLQSPRKNPITGGTHVNDRVLMSAAGSLFEVDDRWQTVDGPTETLTKSLRFRSVASEDGDVLLPEAFDVVRFKTITAAVIDAASDINGLVAVYDFWFRPDRHGVYQTIWQMVDPRSDPQEDAGTHLVHIWLRLRNGRPQFVIGSTNDYEFGIGPERGLYVAEAGGILPVGEWSHVRWYLNQNSSGAKLEKPLCKINGKDVAVEVNAVDELAPNSWLRTDGLSDPGPQVELLMGAAHDAYLFPEQDQSFVVDKIRGLCVRPDFKFGLMHSAAGSLADVVIAVAAASVGASPADFDPKAIDYTGFTFLFRAQLQEGVGHKAQATGLALQYGVIESHPFLSRFHEMGTRENRTSFASFGNEVFCANGGRVVVEEEGASRFAGVIAPSNPPKFALEREPLWKPNVAAVDPEDNADTGVSASGDNGPIGAASVGASADSEQFNHYSTRGNSYLLQTYSDSMDWSSGEHLGIKGYVRMRDTSGRIILWAMKSELRSGRSLEIRDGKVGFYWYDTFLKKEVGVETSAPVIIPGFVHYIFLKKVWPQQDSTEGNWKNSIWNRDASDTDRDVLVVRRFRKAASANAWETDTTFDAKTGGTVRAAISFTTDDVAGPVGTTASGLVTSPTYGPLYGGASGGVVTGGQFYDDMKGMIWQWSSDFAPSNLVGPIYRIKSVDTSTKITVVAEDGVASTDFSGVFPSASGGVFTGITLNKTTDFDNSKEPDDGPHDITWMGHQAQANPLSGIKPFDGETWSFGWANAPNATLIFETPDPGDNILIGTDDFAAEVYSATGTPGPLTFDDDPQTFSAVDEEEAVAANYATTQPNSDLQVAVDATKYPNAAQMMWQRIETATMLQGTTKVYVTFYDPNNNIESTPSPALTVRPQGDDKINVSGEAKVILTEMPTFPGLFRRVYMTLIDQEDAFRVAEIPDDTSSSISLIRSQAEIGRGIAMRFDRNAPPRCEVVAASQGEMWYGALEFQPDGVIPSLAFNPHEVPLAGVVFDSASGQFLQRSRLFVLDSGDNTKITAMSNFKGQMVIAKRNAIWSIVDLYGQTSQHLITDGIGAVSDQSLVMLDNMLYGIDVRGPWVFGGTGVPVYLGTKMENYFEDTIDSAYLDKISSAVNRRRNQYVFTSKRADSDYSNERIALEFDHALSGVVAGLKKAALHKITRYQDPDVTALVEVDSKDGGPRVLVGGTEDGFAVWLDRSDTQRVGLGSDNSVYGPASVTFDNGATTTMLPVDEVMDTDLEGSRGVRVRWRDGTSDREAVVVTSVPTGVYLDRASTFTLPSDGDSGTMGQKLYLWKSRHFDFGIPEQTKALYFVDFTRAVESSGSLGFSLFRDLSTTAFSFAAALTLDLTVAIGEVVVLETQTGQRFQFQLVSSATDTDLDFELFDLTLRFKEIEER